MSNKKLRYLLFLAVFLLTSLLGVQVFWVTKAFDLQEKQFSYDVKQALKNVVIQIKLDEGDSSSLFDPVLQLSPNLFKIGISDVLNPVYLENLLVNEFRMAEIPLDFEYSIYDCFTDSVVYTDLVRFKNLEEVKLELGSKEIKWNNDMHYFSVYFPSKSEFIIKKLRFWIFSTVIVIAVAIFFGITLWILFKQKRLSEIKNDFINNMTHELKTPIATIGLSSNVLLKPGIEKTPERFRNYAEIIKNESLRLKQQVEKVLQVAALEKEEVEIDISEVDVHKVIERAMQVFELTLSEMGGTIKNQFYAKRAVIATDELHLTTVLMNLIDNAIKYSKQNAQIVITTENQHSDLVISISDQGEGIPKHLLPLIFDKFYRIPSGNIHNVKGFGLGLYYVKTMVKRLGGKIEVESQYGKGSTFRILMPL